jgi:hypothetical protein
MGLRFIPPPERVLIGTGLGIANKVPLLAWDLPYGTLSIHLHLKLAAILTFPFDAIADWAQDALARGCG